jgi:hypothetical protein
MTKIAGAGSGSINQRPGSAPKCLGSATLLKGIGLFGILSYNFSPHSMLFLQEKPKRLKVVVDVSGSMYRYVYTLLVL